MLTVFFQCYRLNKINYVKCVIQYVAISNYWIRSNYYYCILMYYSISEIVLVYSGNVFVYYCSIDEL